MTPTKQPGQAGDFARQVHLRRLFDLSPELLCVVGFDGYFKLVNPAFPATLGYTFGELLGRPIMSFVHPDDRDATEHELLSLSAGGVTRHFRTRYLCRDGGLRWIEWSAVAERSGHLIYAAARDVTEQRRLEQSREDALATARAASRLKTQFLANLSHEIRTPLTALLGYLELLLLRDRPDAEREYEQIIRKNGELLLSLINDLVELSRLEASQAELRPGSVAPRALVEEVAEALRPLAMDKALTLEVRCEPALPQEVVTDGLRLRQVLRHLIGNAIKFTSQGGVTIACATEEECGRPVLRFTVRDSGPGIPAAELHQLFHPFAQVDSSPSRRSGGMGVGLALSRHLVDLLGGTLTVRSAPGQGCEFSFFVPLATAAATVPGSAAAAPGEPVRLRGRVLIAEDTRDTQLLLRRYLERAGAEVTIADNGRRAVEAVLRATTAGAPFDLVLMDMQMPELDGYQATGALRRAGFSGPIIAVTAHAMPGDEDRCLQAGCDDFLNKPVSSVELVRTAEHYLRPRG